MIVLRYSLDTQQRFDMEVIHLLAKELGFCFAKQGCIIERKRNTDVSYERLRPLKTLIWNILEISNQFSGDWSLILKIPHKPYGVRF